MIGNDYDNELNKLKYEGRHQKEESPTRAQNEKVFEANTDLSSVLQAPEREQVKCSLTSFREGGQNETMMD